ncbi:MAG TPA: hypothetical protein ENN17_09735 [bacterium]|nr:hypothetical protein [bacterium]
MKKWMPVLFLIGASGLFAREQTLISGDIQHGGFGGPVVKFGNVLDECGVFVGGRGGWIINHQFVLGGGGYGLVNEIASRRDADLFYSFGYGGLEIEYIAASDRLVHLTFQALIGAGGVRLYEKINGTRFDDETNTVETDAIFVAEPGVNVELNVTPFFRIGFGAHYRFVSELDMPGLKAGDLSGLSAAITLKFGKF